MRALRVVAAVIVRTDAGGGSRVLATQRGYGDWKGWWEFPGGKVEGGETPEAALVREIGEELAMEVAPRSLLGTVEYDYPDFHLSMHCYACSVVRGAPCLREHQDAAWLSAGELGTVRWLPADREILPAVARHLQSVRQQTLNPSK